MLLAERPRLEREERFYLCVLIKEYLENADLTVINLVIADVSAEILGSRDSACSNAFFYLRKNSLLQPKEIDSIAKTLNSHGVFED